MLPASLASPSPNARQARPPSTWMQCGIAPSWCAWRRSLQGQPATQNNDFGSPNWASKKVPESGFKFPTYLKTLYLRKYEAQNGLQKTAPKVLRETAQRKLHFVGPLRVQAAIHGKAFQHPSTRYALLAPMRML